MNLWLLATVYILDTAILLDNVNPLILIIDLQGYTQTRKKNSQVFPDHLKKKNCLIPNRYSTHSGL